MTSILKITSALQLGTNDLLAAEDGATALSRLPASNEFGKALSGVPYERIGSVIVSEVQAKVRTTQVWVGFPADVKKHVIPIHSLSNFHCIFKKRNPLPPGKLEVTEKEAPLLWSLEANVRTPRLLSAVAGSGETHVEGYFQQVLSILFAKFPTAIGEWIIACHDTQKRRAWTMLDVDVLSSAALAAGAAIDDYVYSTTASTTADEFLSSFGPLVDINDRRRIDDDEDVLELPTPLVLVR